MYQDVWPNPTNRAVERTPRTKGFVVMKESSDTFKQALINYIIVCIPTSSSIEINPILSQFSLYVVVEPSLIETGNHSQRVKSYITSTLRES